jgi:O-antigen/teichoic acid export membrane protein
MDRAVLVPVNLVIMALSQVFSAKLARDLRSGGGESAEMFRSMVRWSAFVGLVPTMIGYWYISPVVLFLFGREWQTAADIAQILVVYNYVSFVVGAVLQTLVIAGAQRRQIAWDLGRFIAAITVWGCIIGLHLGLKSALALHYGVQSLCYVIYLFLGYRLLSGVRGHKLVSPSAPVAPVSTAL